MKNYIPNTQITKKIINPKNLEDLYDVQQFIEKNINGSKFFRYFKKRTYDVLENHLYTCLYFEKNNCVGYGHLDFYEQKIWLGIIVTDSLTGNGFGKKIMNDLINQTDNEIFLSVDKENVIAIKLYEKLGFNLLDITENYFIMKLNKKT